MNQSEFIAITCNLFKARQKLGVQSAIGFGFGFASHWLKNWRENWLEENGCEIVKNENRAFCSLSMLHM